MSTGAIIAIVIGVLILLALLWFLGRKGRERKLETRRHEAREIRREAEVGRAQADKTRAEADAQAAEARRQEALARERSASAEEQRRDARERHIEAAKKDPDADPDEAAAEFDRQHPAADTSTATGAGTVSDPGTTAAETGTATGGRGAADQPDVPGRDQSVEHYERTSGPDVDRERHFERDEEGDVVRGETHEQPRTNR
jgi:F0F1-type ATP synthase membrane subunit b/b'